MSDAHQTTKICPKCGTSDLVLLRSINRKVCSECGIDILWVLADCQKPLLSKTHKK